jgi:hypothetical protein
VTNRKDNVIRRIEAVLWVLGLACLGFSGLSKMQSTRGQTVAIAELETNWQQEELAGPDRSL